MPPRPLVLPELHQSQGPEVLGLLGKGPPKSLLRLGVAGEGEEGPAPEVGRLPFRLLRQEREGLGVAARLQEGPGLLQGHGHLLRLLRRRGLPLLQPHRRQGLGLPGEDEEVLPLPHPLHPVKPQAPKALLHPLGAFAQKRPVAVDEKPPGRRRRAKRGRRSKKAKRFQKASGARRLSRPWSTSPSGKTERRSRVSKGGSSTSSAQPRCQTTSGTLFLPTSTASSTPSRACHSRSGRFLCRKPTKAPVKAPTLEDPPLHPGEALWRRTPGGGGASRRPGPPPWGP